jgi:hypothetical protein
MYAKSENAKSYVIVYGVGCDMTVIPVTTLPMFWDNVWLYDNQTNKFLNGSIQTDLVSHNFRFTEKGQP